MNPDTILALLRDVLQELSPRRLTEQELRERPPGGRLHLLAAGKAAAAMSLGALDAGLEFASARVVIPRGSQLPADFPWPCQECGHPLPDGASFEAGAWALQTAAALGPEDTLLFLLSGGASALLENPAPGLSSGQIVQLYRELLRAGLPIAETNLLRRHASALKGGRLAATAWPAAVRTLIVSDVSPDRPEIVASGPSWGDSSRRLEALALLQESGLASRLPWLVNYWSKEADDPQLEPIRPGDRRLERTENRVILDRRRLLKCLQSRLATADWQTLVLEDDFDAPVAEMARRLVGRARKLQPGQMELAAGELTLKVTGSGQGGRNQELAARLLETLPKGCFFYSFASDGVDGVTPHPVALAFVDDEVRARLQASGLAPASFLADNHSYPLLQRLAALRSCGPTGHNLGDLLILGRPRRAETT